MDTCWIHITNLRYFLYLGVNPAEEKIGQNIKVDLSLKIKYTGTEDKLNNTVDYGAVAEYLEQKIRALNKVQLLEYLAEQILIALGEKFKQIAAARIVIQKAYVPLAHFTGEVKIEAERTY